MKLSRDYRHHAVLPGGLRHHGLLDQSVDSIPSEFDLRRLKRNRAVMDTQKYSA